jgi:bifunctional non-homologous end joining protein LigD
MLASLIEAPLDDPQFVYEPKYDGIRVIAEVDAGGRHVRLWSRLGNEKTAQFPEVVDALTAWAKKRRDAVVLDGELVALDDEGRPAGFQRLQGRIHVKEILRARRKTRVSGTKPAVPVPPSGPVETALILFDVLREGETDWRARPLTERRQALERIIGRLRTKVLRLSEQATGDGRALYTRAQAEGWEGLIAKRASSRYLSGKRTPDWRKLKILHEQEFVIGGWTEPRQSRTHFGALLLGVFETVARPSTREQRRLIYSGHVGTGFDERELAKVKALLAKRHTTTCPFGERPPTNETPHWVTPDLVAQIRFTEWTDDGILRHPVYLGLRDDKKAEDVVREGVTTPAAVKGTDGTGGTRGTARTRTRGTRTSGTRTSGTRGTNGTLGTDIASVVSQLTTLESSRKDGTLSLSDGKTVAVTNLHKVFWPSQKYTKGDLFRYYVSVAPYILPVIADRPLVMKRFPNGVSAKPFYQHRAERVPDTVRTGTVPGSEARDQIIGGDLATLLYTTQLAAISQDPWFSRLQSPDAADHVALDLDPADGVPFARVLDVARWIRDELATVGAVGFPKTSGADGLHVYVPLPRNTPYDAGLLFAQIIATIVAHKHPRVATIERSVRARGPKVYVDCLQNIRGKTLASAYSVRASAYAGVSTPLSWDEIDAGVQREAFTIASVPKRLEQVGDLWAPLAIAKGADLERIARLAGKAR